MNDATPSLLLGVDPGYEFENRLGMSVAERHPWFLIVVDVVELQRQPLKEVRQPGWSLARCCDADQRDIGLEGRTRKDFSFELRNVIDGEDHRSITLFHSNPLTFPSPESA